VTVRNVNQRRPKKPIVNRRLDDNIIIFGYCPKGFNSESGDDNTNWQKTMNSTRQAVKSLRVFKSAGVLLLLAHLISCGGSSSPTGSVGQSAASANVTADSQPLASKPSKRPNSTIPLDR
jgi:hypothetical protein